MLTKAGNMSQNPEPARVSSPGRILSRELDARGWTQKDFAEIMNCPAQAINEIIKGTKQITPETAYDLSETLGTSPNFWANLESKYRRGFSDREHLLINLPEFPGSCFVEETLGTQNQD
jgi:addiction module HigA family antidote